MSSVDDVARCIREMPTDLQSEPIALGGVCAEVVPIMIGDNNIINIYCVPCSKQNHQEGE